MWDEPNVELKCQSVHQDMMFLASNSLHNLRGQKWSCPCYHARHLQQIHRNKNFCRMYGLGVMLDMTTPKVHLTIQIVVYLGRWKKIIKNSNPAVENSRLILWSHIFLCFNHFRTEARTVCERQHKDFEIASL